jgi:hypothetical protein
MAGPRGWVASLMLASSLGCASQVAAPPATTSSEAAPPPPPPPSQAGSKCEYRIGESCYTNSHDACTAAGCKPDRCDTTYSLPAIVTCR